MLLLCYGWKKLLERTDGSTTSSVGQIEGRKGRSWRNACIACSLTAGTSRAGLGEKTENGNQVILKSTAYIMPGSRAAGTHLSLSTTGLSRKSLCPSSAGPDLSGARGTGHGTSSRRCFLLSRDLFSRMGISRQSPKDIHDLMFAFSVDSRGIRKWRKGCDLVSFSPKGNGH